MIIFQILILMHIHVGNSYIIHDFFREKEWTLDIVHKRSLHGYIPHPNSDGTLLKKIKSEETLMKIADNLYVKSIDVEEMFSIVDAIYFMEKSNQNSLAVIKCYDRTIIENFIEKYEVTVIEVLSTDFYVSGYVKDANVYVCIGYFSKDDSFRFKEGDKLSIMDHIEYEKATQHKTYDDLVFYLDERY